MSILIKGMEMPTSCPCDLLGIGYDFYCSFAGGIPARVKEYYECCQNGTRPSWCPLVPVPPHGRLIDADALKTKWDDEVARLIEKGIEYLDYHVYTLFSDFKKDVDKMPTIISEEEGE